MEENKIYLSEKEMPQAWYNILPDLPEPLPPVIHPKTRQPVKPEDLAPIFPMSLIMQEFSPERWIEIPDDVLNAYKIYRPTPLHRARNLEKALKTKARIYFKNESVSPPGSHKPNTAIAQAKDPIKMAVAMKHAVIAGRLAYLAGRIPKKMYASASSPLEGVIGRN